MAVKIEFADGTGTLTFAYNPLSFDDELNSNNTKNPLPYQNYNIVVSGGAGAPKKIVLAGHFSGTNKETDYLAFSKFVFSRELQRLYFSSTKFYLGFLTQCKKTYAGGRTNFIDYVATFEPVTTLLFSATQKTSGTNEGNISTFVEEISGQHDGSGDIVLSDGTNSVTIKEADLSGNTYFRYSFVKMIDSISLKITKFGTIEVDDNSNFTSPTLKSTVNIGLLQLAPGANISTVTATNTTGTVTKKFRDAYSA